MEAPNKHSKRWLHVYPLDRYASFLYVKPRPVLLSWAVHMVRSIVHGCCLCSLQKVPQVQIRCDFVPSGLILYPHYSLIHWLLPWTHVHVDELMYMYMYVYTCTVLGQLYSMCTQHALCIVNLCQNTLLWPLVLELHLNPYKQKQLQFHCSEKITNKLGGKVL